jgi:hypothetical protein
MKQMQRRSGQSMVELLGGLVILIPVVLVLLDLAIIVIAVQVNDGACRDAARAAAAGRPVAYTNANGTTFPETAKSRAQGVITRAAAGAKGYISVLELVDADTHPNPVAIVAPDPQFGGAYQGSYQVTTHMRVNVPASIPGVTPEFIDLNARQEFPITMIEPNSSAPL